LVYIFITDSMDVT